MDRVKYPSGTTFTKNGREHSIMGYIYYGACGLYYTVVDTDGVPHEYARDEVDEFMAQSY